MELDKTQVAVEAAVGQGSVKALREMQICKKTKNSSPICLFLLSNNVELINNNREGVEHRLECCGCVNSCNKFVSTRLC